MLVFLPCGLPLKTMGMDMNMRIATRQYSAARLGKLTFVLNKTHCDNFCFKYCFLQTAHFWGRAWPRGHITAHVHRQKTARSVSGQPDHNKVPARTFHQGHICILRKKGQQDMYGGLGIVPNGGFGKQCEFFRNLEDIMKLNFVIQ